MKLEDIKPQETSIRLESTKTTYKLRRFNLEDEIWLGQEYGDKISEVFNPRCPDFEAICRIVYRQIENREDFESREVTIIDMDGVKTTKTLGGYRLLCAATVGDDEKLSIINALNITMGLSRPEPTSKKKALRRLIGLKS